MWRKGTAVVQVPVWTRRTNSTAFVRFWIVEMDFYEGSPLRLTKHKLTLRFTEGVPRGESRQKERSRRTILVYRRVSLEIPLWVLTTKGNIE